MKLKKSISIISLLIVAIVGITSIVTLPAYADSTTSVGSDDKKSVCKNDNVPEEVREAAGCDTGSEAEEKLPNLIKNILNAIITTSGLVAVVFIVIGGYNYMTSTGDAAKLKKGKDTILYACIGLAICVLSFAIVNFVISDILTTNSSSTSETKP